MRIAIILYGYFFIDNQVALYRASHSKNQLKSYYFPDDGYKHFLSHIYYPLLDIYGNVDVYMITHDFEHPRYNELKQTLIDTCTGFNFYFTNKLECPKLPYTYRTILKYVKDTNIHYDRLVITRGDLFYKGKINSWLPERTDKDFCWFLFKDYYNTWVKNKLMCDICFIIDNKGDAIRKFIGAITRQIDHDNKKNDLHHCYHNFYNEFGGNINNIVEGYYDSNSSKKVKESCNPIYVMINRKYYFNEYNELLHDVEDLLFSITKINRISEKLIKQSYENTKRIQGRNVVVVEIKKTINDKNKKNIWNGRNDTQTKNRNNNILKNYKNIYNNNIINMPISFLTKRTNKSPLNKVQRKKVSPLKSRLKSGNITKGKFAPLAKTRISFGARAGVAGGVKAQAKQPLRTMRSQVPAKVGVKPVGRVSAVQSVAKVVQNKPINRIGKMGGAKPVSKVVAPVVKPELTSVKPKPNIKVDEENINKIVNEIMNRQNANSLFHEKKTSTRLKMRRNSEFGSDVEQTSPVSSALLTPQTSYAKGNLPMGDDESPPQVTDTDGPPAENDINVRPTRKTGKATTQSIGKFISFGS